MLHPKVVQEIREIEHRLRAADRLPTPDKLQQYYATFRDRFGPEKLKGLDGEALLILMHGLFRDNRNTLPYWLEFKDDDEFPFIFGSISGGSALKYGVYPNAETGEWMTRAPGRSSPMPISLEQAVEIARKHREQLVQGCALLGLFPHDGSDEQYHTLQAQMNELAPDVSDTAWGHKYFSLISPEKLDDYHNEKFQRFHLIRMLQVPPNEAGRYVAAGCYVRVARELAMPINHLTTILNERNARPYRYWRLRSSGADGLAEDEIWRLMQGQNCIALGCGPLGSLADITHDRAGKEELGGRLSVINMNGGRVKQDLFDYVTNVKAGDIVAVMRGKKVGGIARVVGEYYEDAAAMPYRWPVEWLTVEPWTPQNGEGLVDDGIPKFREANRLAMQLEMEHRILDRSITQASVDDGGRPRLPTHIPLDGIPRTIQSILERKGQVILYGPPGTGKTHWAEEAALELAARNVYGRRHADLTPEERQAIFGAQNAYVRLCSFHPAYGYEDFLEGYRPAVVDGRMHFALKNGIFKQLCEDAAGNPERHYYLIIDEINRGDIPRIFGELLTLIEKNKRGKPAILPLSGTRLAVPPNVFVIGTMNTADRSVALLDAALRRRFGFLELMPDVVVLAEASVRRLPLGAWLRELNRRILEHVGRDARNLQIGHAYLLDDGKPISDAPRFVRVIREDIIPLLEEYCYEDYDTLERILGTGVVDVTGQRIRQELFVPGKEDDLIKALLQPTPDLATSVPEPAGDAAEEADEEENDADEARP